MPGSRRYVLVWHRSDAPTGVDFQELRARAESIGAGVRLTLVICAAGWLYVAATWDRPDRQLIASLFGLGAIVALLFVLIPHERVVRSRWREPFFLLWSITQIALTTVVVAADGGSTSPLALLFFIPVIFAALSYPLASVVAIGALDYVAYVAVGVAGDRPDPEYVGFFALCLGCTAVLCGWHARNQDRRREALARVSRADPLTGCLNRRGFEERFESELSRALRSGRPVGLIMLDLDHFKDVNDTRGHAAGDEILRWAVDVMERHGAPDGHDRPRRRRRVRRDRPRRGPGRLRRRSQVGSCSGARAPGARIRRGGGASPTDGADRDELQRSADAKLYAGKRGSRTRGARQDDRQGAQLGDRAGPRGRRAHGGPARALVEGGRVLRSGSPSGSAGAERDLELLQMAAILHDVGKVSIPDHVLRKPQPLTEREWEAIKQNPVRGAEMVSRIQGLETIVPWIRHSLERMRRQRLPGRPERRGRSRSRAASCTWRTPTTR